MAVLPKTKVVTVTTSGTRVPVLVSGDGFIQHNITYCVIQAISGTIYVGDATVSATGPIGHQLVSGNTVNSVTLSGDAANAIDLTKVYLDGAASGAKANVTYFVKVS